MSENKQIHDIINKEYKLGFETLVQSDTFAKGLNEDVIRAISAKKEEPSWLLDFRLKAYAKWLKMEEPSWANLNYGKIDYQDLAYYSAPRKALDSLDEVDPEILKTYEKLGIPLEEQKMLAGVAVDAVFDSVSVKTTYQDELEKLGIIFCSISEAAHRFPDLVKTYLASVVPVVDNYFACLNSAVFTDGSFVYIPPNVRCPMELSTYIRINALDTGQFERSLIICDENSYVSYNEGCSAPSREERQLHAAVVELVALKNAQIKYSTIQNWFPGDENGKGGILNFVTKRALCKGDNSKVSWTQVETGSSITWKYPSCVLQGDNSVGEFYSVAIASKGQQADTGTKMVHLGKNTKSTIISKGISAMKGINAYRGLVRVGKNASNARNISECDSLLIGNRCHAHTYPYHEIRNSSANIEHEATTSKISDEQLFYISQRGISEENAIAMIVNGFCKEVLKELPMEFAAEAKELLNISLEGSVG
ncbi:MAG: Fe-S cluster assembly protein SufB [Aliarcobacter sp.]|nr:Fe-S cluster assembly protein SufB [Aliarcobacter sp.]